MSSSAPHLFGERVEDFTTKERELLASRSPDGVFGNWSGDTAVMLANNPGWRVVTVDLTRRLRLQPHRSSWVTLCYAREAET